MKHYSDKLGQHKWRKQWANVLVMKVMKQVLMVFTPRELTYIVQRLMEETLNIIVKIVSYLVI